jgi:DNA modification methylase
MSNNPSLKKQSQNGVAATVRAGNSKALRAGVCSSNEPHLKASSDAEHFVAIVRADARRLPLANESVDLIATSPPYWRKRNYGVAGQIGREASPEAYVEQIKSVLSEWRRVLKVTGSAFLNIGDTWLNRSLVDIPGRVIAAALDDGWVLRNRIIWAKTNGTPDPVSNRLASRHEHIIHLTVGHEYYYDLFGYAERFGNGSNPGDVWIINPGKNAGGHLAPFPEEIAERIVTLACPAKICRRCGAPRRRLVRRTAQLNPLRPQARRALEIAREFGLTAAHIAAIQATGISDAGKALRNQTGAGRNAAHVRKLASEAKAVLGGYFREFTFPVRESAGWTKCGCKAGFRPGLVLDPFMGTGTTLRVAESLKRLAIGIDLAPSHTLSIPANQG